MNSASSRWRGPRASSRFSLSRASNSGVTVAVWRYVALITICLIVRLISQSRAKSAASHSSSSGWTGPFALRAEIIQRLHQAGSENHRPPAVDRDARGQRVLRRDEPLREIEPV
jgi:hypothetical protein